MIALLLLWLVLLPALTAVGWLGMRIVGAAPQGDAPDDAFEAFWTGLAIAAAGFLAAGLIGPVGAWTLAGLLVVGVIVSPQAAMLRGMRRWDLAVVAGACVLAAWFAAGRVVYFDTAYYHLQAVRMLHAFGVVQGAHLIAEVYGSISSWFALAAPFNGGSLAGLGTGIVNGLATAMAMAQSLIAFRRLLWREGTAADALLCVGLTLTLGLVLRWHMVASVTPDLPLLFLPPILGWMMMRRRRSDLAPVLLAAGAATIKLSAAPLVLIAVCWALGHRARPLPRLLGCAAVVLPFAVTAVAAFLLTSGCLVFPIAATCVDVAWAMPADRVADFAQRVTSGAGTGGSAHAAAAGIEAPLARLWFWMRHDTSSAALALAFLGAVLAMLPVLRRPAMDGLRWPLALAVLGAVYVGATAPVGRFAGGYVALSLGVAAACLYRLPMATALGGKAIAGWRGWAGILGLVLIVLGFAVARLSAPLAREAARVEAAVAAGLLPSEPSRSRLILPLPVVPYVLNEADPALPVRYRRILRDGVAYVQPEGDGACWAHEPPCGVAARLADPARGLRGGLIRER